MSQINKLWNVLRRFKYVIVLVLGVAIVGFIDENSVLSHVRNVRHIGDLDTEIEQYRRSYERDNEQLHLLDRDPKAIERIARERYFMKADDEDIFVLSDDL